MRTPAQIHPIALPIDRYVVLRDSLDYLDLVMLAHPLEDADRFVAADLDPLDFQVGLGQLAHLLLDLRQVLERKRMRRCKIVVEPVLNRRPDRHLRTRK